MSAALGSPVASAPPSRAWLPVRVYNTLAERLPVPVPGLGGVAELHAAAAGKAPDADFGDPEYLTGLRALLSALDTEADLTPAGRLFARGAVVGALTNRLLVQRALAAEPGIASRPVDPALVIVGLPRSGTTLLQHLLALDPANRSLRQWEAARPAPPPQPGADSFDPRVAAAERAVRTLDRLAPAARVLHPTGTWLPCECVTLFANSFTSLEFSTIYQVPSYTTWCLGTDMRPHYAYYATQLQVLGWRDHRQRWVLKSPAHLFWLEQLAAALPRVGLVQVHRDPTEVIGSFASLAAVLAATNARRVDRVAIGRFWLRTWAEGVRRAQAARRTIGNPIHDVRYKDLVADPIGCVADLYAAFDLPFTRFFETAMRDHLARPRRGDGRHAYALETFGLRAADVHEQFEAAGHVLW